MMGIMCGWRGEDVGERSEIESNTQFSKSWLLAWRPCSGLALGLLLPIWPVAQTLQTKSPAEESVGNISILPSHSKRLGKSCTCSSSCLLLLQHHLLSPVTIPNCCNHRCVGKDSRQKRSIEVQISVPYFLSEKSRNENIRPMPSGQL